jgi:hypothetical protein
MGMSNSDDEDAIREQHDLLEWAKQAPEPLNDEYRHTEDEIADHTHRVQEHLKKKPRVHPSRSRKRR